MSELKNIKPINYLSKITLPLLIWLSTIALFDILFINFATFLDSSPWLFYLPIAIVIIGIVSFISLIYYLGKHFDSKYSQTKSSLISGLSFILFLIIGLCFLITPFALINNTSKKITNTYPSKNNLISAGLKIGSNGNPVRIVQSALSKDKNLYPSGIVSGYYGEMTKQAVINFQNKYNLKSSGEIDIQTANKFNEVYGDKTSDYYISSSYENINIKTTNSINQRYIDSDPLINCGVHINCGGGSRQLKQSVCNQSTCCQIGNTWLFYESKTKCSQDQISYNNQNRPQYVMPTFKPLPTWAPIPTLKPLPTWTVPTYEPLPTIPPMPTKDPYCDSVNNLWDSYKRDFMDNQYNNFSSSAEAMQYLEKMRQNMQIVVDSHNCNIHLYLY